MIDVNKLINDNTTPGFATSHPELVSAISKALTEARRDELNASLAELREGFPDRAIIVRNGGSWPPTQDAPTLEIEIVVYGHPIWTGATLSEAMQAVRDWKGKQ